MVDFREIKSAPTGTETAHHAYFSGREGALARPVVEAHPHTYFKVAVTTGSRADLDMVCRDCGIHLLPDTATTIDGSLSFIVARQHEVHLLAGQFAGQNAKINLSYVTPLEAYQMAEEGLHPIHISQLQPPSLAPCAPLSQEPSRIAASPLEKALMLENPLTAFLFVAHSSAKPEDLAAKVDQELAVLAGLLHTPRVPQGGVCFIAYRDGAEAVANTSGAEVALVRPLEAFSAHYMHGDEVRDFPYQNGRPQFVPVAVSNGRISVLKLSQGAN